MSLAMLVLAEVALRIHAARQPDDAAFTPEPVPPGNPTPLDLRGPRFGFEPDQFRIVAIGDSFTWGDQVYAHADIWPVRLETALQDQLGHPVGVVNLAQRGLTCLASAHVLDKYGAPMRPQLVLYGFYLNDALRNLPDGRYLIWDDLWGRLLPEPAHTWAANHSMLYTRLDAVRLAWKIRTDPEGWNKLYAAGAEEWQQFQDGLRLMAQSAWRSRAPVVVVQFPDFAVQSLQTGSYQWADIHARVGAAAQELGMHVIDLTPVYAAEGGRPKAWCATPTNCHPNERGHAVAAEAVAAFLRDRNLLPDAPPAG